VAGSVGALVAGGPTLLREAVSASLPIKRFFLVLATAGCTERWSLDHGRQLLRLLRF